jgi:hypothetical protein
VPNVGARYLVAVHAGHIKAVGCACGIEHGVVACAFCTKAKVVTHQHVFHAQAFDQHLFNEGLRRLRGKGLVEGQDHALVDTASGQLVELVAQGGNAGGGKVGLLVLLGKEVARMRLKRHHATGHAAVTCLIDQQSQHGLMATVHAVKVANGQGASLGQLRVMKTSKNLHGLNVG